jgi:fermentation-respiration switch protein FrsA (DUF1100 family)
MLALGYAALAGLVYFGQDRLVYFPEVGRNDVATPRDIGLDYESVTLTTEDGERLDAWYVPVAAPRGTVLVCHGNAGHMGHRLPLLRMFHRLGYAVFIFDYRGYGRSSGRPSEDGLYRDARAAWEYLARERGATPEDMVFYGESLGGAVAARLALQARPAALVLASTFTSAPDLGAEHYRFLPVRLLARVNYDTLAAVREFPGAVLVAHSPQDEIVPLRQGRALYDAAPGPKAFLQLQGGHNDGFVFMREEWTQALGRFLGEHVGP